MVTLVVGGHFAKEPTLVHVQHVENHYVGW